MTATVGTATVRSASTVETATITTVERLPAMEASTVTAPEALSATESATVVKAAVATEPFTATEPAAVPATFTVETFSATESFTAVEPMPPAIVAAPAPAVEPRTGANKHATVKIIRTVVPIRCAGIRRIAVITISAVRWRRIVHRAAVTVPAVNRSDSDSDSDLGAGRTGHARPCDQNPQQKRVL